MKKPFCLAFVWFLMLGLPALAQDTVIPHVPTAAELVDGVSIIIDGNGDMATSSGTNGVTTTGDVEPFQYIMRNGADNAYVGQYGPRAVTNWVALTEYYPQQLVRGVSSNVYYAATHIYPYVTNYPGFLTGTNFINPVPGVHDQWVLFASDGLNGAAGANGSAGATGPAGANGATNIAWSVWSSTVGYFTTTPTIVQYAGQWYHLISDSSNDVPLTTTSKWEVSVAQGLNGTILGSNIFYRSAWSAFTTYNTNDAVDYIGSLFVVGPTNVSVVGAEPDPSDVPTNRANWNVLVRKGTVGATGATGPQGPSGAVVTNINNYQTFVLTGLQWLALGSASNPSVAGLFIQPGTNFVMTYNATTGVSTLTIPVHSVTNRIIPTTLSIGAGATATVVGANANWFFLNPTGATCSVAFDVGSLADTNFGILYRIDINNSTTITTFAANSIASSGQSSSTNTTLYANEPSVFYFDRAVGSTDKVSIVQRLK